MNRTDPAQAVLDRLVEIQDSKGLTGVEMAAVLGIGASMWCRLRKGSRAIGSKTLRAAFRAYPDLAPLYVQLVRDRPENGASVTTSEAVA